MRPIQIWDRTLHALSADIAALLQHLRRTFSQQPDWTGLESQAAATRSGAHFVRVRPADGIERSPAHVGAVE